MSDQSRPPVIVWFRAYCIFMALLYLLVAAAGGFMVTANRWIAARDPTVDAMELIIIGGIWLVIGIALTIPFVVALLLDPKPWVWIYHLVLIGLGMTSVCCLPATIPLLIFWIKPETKNWYGRTE